LPKKDNKKNLKFSQVKNIFLSSKNYKLRFLLLNTKRKATLIFIITIVITNFLILNLLTLTNIKTRAHYPNTYYCKARFITHNITIDGKMTGDEWNFINKNLLIFDFLDDVYVGNIYFAWDFNFLYLFAQILDEDETNEKGFFIFFDEAHNGTFGYYEDVRGVFSNNTRVNMHINEDKLLQLDFNEPNFQAFYSFNNITGFQQFEMAIPFSNISENLNINPKIGLTIGIDLEYWNGTFYDDYPDNGRRKVVWSNPAYYGDLYFSGMIISYDFSWLINSLTIAITIIIILLGVIIVLKFCKIKKSQKNNT